MFLQRLESLRGLAALMVAVGHSFLVLSIYGITKIWTLKISDINGIQAFLVRFIITIFNGGAAVTIFFVLSGYLLSLSLDKNKLSFLRSISFYSRRICRIFPAHLICLFLIVITILFFHTYIRFENTSDWFNWYFKDKITIKRIIHNIVLYKTNLNPVTWTLKIEILISFIFPIAYYISRNITVIQNIIFILLLVVLSYFKQNTNLALYYTAPLT